MISGSDSSLLIKGETADPRLIDICVYYLRHQSFDASLLVQLPDDVSAKDLPTLCQNPYYERQVSWSDEYQS